MIISKHRISVHRLDISYIDIKELLDMHKKVYVFLLVCLLLAGCSSDKTNPSVENEKNLIIDINKIQLPVGQDCSLGSYYVDGDVVYYSVYMSLGDYEENPDAEFDVSMETEIRSFDITSNEQKMVYQYDAGYSVDVNDMGICNGKLYWLDSAGTEEEWFRVVAVSTGKSKDIEVLFTSEDISESCRMITPETDGKMIYFYAEDDGKISICEYTQEKLKNISENVYTNSAYEHLSKWKDTYATAVKTDDGYEIVTINEDGNCSDYETVSAVSELQMNEEYMSYLSDPYNYRNEVNVIHKEDHSVEQIKTDRFFNYGLLGNYLIFNKSDRITAYDLLSGEETEILKAEQDSFEWMFRRGETLCTKNGNEIYEKFSNDIEEFRKKCDKLHYIHIPGKELIGTNEVFDVDLSKLIINSSMGGKPMNDILRKKFHLEMEMEAAKYVLAITTFCDNKEGFDRLYKALDYIDAELKKITNKSEIKKIKNTNFELVRNIQEMSISNAVNSNTKLVNIENAINKVSAEYLYLYPPGIPLIVPGEVVNVKLVEQIKEYKNRNYEIVRYDKFKIVD